MATVHSTPDLLLQVPGAGSKARSVPGDSRRALHTDDLRPAPSIGALTVEDDLVGLLYRSLERPDGADPFDVFRADNVGPQGSGSGSSHSSCNNQYGCDADQPFHVAHHRRLLPRSVSERGEKEPQHLGGVAPDPSRPGLTSFRQLECTRVGERLEPSVPDQ